MTCTNCNTPPFAHAVLAEADKLVPGRRRSSDGTCGDAAHRAEISDHNPSGPNCYCHAVDISQSTPGSPYWDPKYAVFDAHAYGWEIGRRMIAGTEKRVKYLVSFNGQVDVILNLAVSSNWRVNGTPKQDHASHLHVSFMPAAEQSVAPFLAYAAPPVPPSGDEVTPADIELIRQVMKQTIEEAIGGASMTPPDPHATVVDVVKHYTPKP